MPEYDIANALEHEVSKALCSEAKITKSWPEASSPIHTTLTADRGDYQESQEPLPNLRFYENEWDIARVPNDADWRIWHVHQLESGPCFMWLLTDPSLAPWNCVPGANEDPDKAKLMRSFNLPAKFHESGARSMEKLTVNVFAAIVTRNTAIVFTDFSRLLRLHLWNIRLWSAFPEDQIGTSNQIKSNQIGKHLANDFLYEVAIHPDTPSFALCSNETLFPRLRAHLPIFMARWTSSKFLTASTPLRNPYNKAFVPLKNQWKEMPVRFFVVSNTNRYHIIKARVPAGWPDCPEDTTLGPASFREQVINKLDLEQAKGLVRGGRPPEARFTLPLSAVY
ncbi:hypothetical protein R3P38DRAFT_3322091 [Favolaschia claudopus]|uniref:Uncharacterized protein n=1 Tax=Favolaschia claudopus TaxID=2862362 RepID=A0AAW0AMM4_9AGAR